MSSNKLVAVSQVSQNQRLFLWINYIWVYGMTKEKINNQFCKDCSSCITPCGRTVNKTAYYDFDQYILVTRKDGFVSKRYRHWCSICKKERGFAYKNKILKASYCHACKMQQPDVLEKISDSSKTRIHADTTKAKISLSLYKNARDRPIKPKNKSLILNQRLRKNLRSRLNKAVQGGYKSGSAVTDLGCTIEEFKAYFRALFVDNMSWSNYGEWHIDHIKPLSKFNLQDIVEFKIACHYTNLQPLWAEDNTKKGAQYE